MFRFVWAALKIVIIAFMTFLILNIRVGDTFLFFHIRSWIDSKINPSTQMIHVDQVKEKVKSVF